jgi:hypothetical protein
MRKMLVEGDRVSYATASRRMRATVANHLPFKPQKEVLIIKRKKEMWVKRELLRALPNKK